MNPVIDSALRAALTAMFHALMLDAYLHFAAADIFLDTILPALFLVSPPLFKPPEVLSREPRKTRALAYLPLAILLMRLVFMVRMKTKHISKIARGNFADALGLHGPH